MGLSEAQAAFRRSPGRATALAYMDAAIGEFEYDYYTDNQGGIAFIKQMQEIRDWLMNERTP